MFRRLLFAILFLNVLVSFVPVTTVPIIAAGSIHVKDYGAFPNDINDDTLAIQNAINSAKAGNITTLNFDAGLYLIGDVTQTATSSPGYNYTVLLKLEGITAGMTLLGTTDASGKPTTQLIYDYNPTGDGNFNAAYVIWAQNSSNIRFQNLLLDVPAAIAAGTIFYVGGGKTQINLFPEVLKPQTTLTDRYAAHYNISTRETQQVHTALTFTPISGHKLEINKQIGAVGDGLACMVQPLVSAQHMFMGHKVTNLTFDNVTTVAGIGHAFVPVGCKNITLNKFKFDPGARGTFRGWFSRRDGFTMRACKGTFTVTNSDMGYTSDDTLAWWPEKLYVHQIVDSDTIKARLVQSTGDNFLDFPFFFEAGDWIEFQNGTDPITVNAPSGVRRTLVSATGYTRVSWSTVEYTLNFTSALPTLFVGQNILPNCVLDATIQNSTFREHTNLASIHPAGGTMNIFNCTIGGLIRTSDGQTFIGPSGGWHGCGPMTDGDISGNIFKPTKLTKLQTGQNRFWIKGYNQYSLDIHDNSFYDNYAIDITKTFNCSIRNNTWYNSSGVQIILSTAYPPVNLTQSNNKTGTGTPTPTPVTTPTPTPPGGTATYQAEVYTAQSGCTVQTAQPGYTGTGYMDYGGNGTWVEWNNVYVSSAGTYTLAFTHANGGTTNRQCALNVNGAAAGNIPFAPTGSWTTWTAVSVNVTLNAGNNIIRVTANTANQGPNLDKLDVTGP